VLENEYLPIPHFSPPLVASTRHSSKQIVGRSRKVVRN
jgi:hypothetical protein